MDKSDVIIREGSARLPQNETGFLKAQRQKELESRQKTFRWNNWKPGFPPIIDGKLDDLHLDFQFDKEKKAHFTWNSVKLVLDQGLDTVKGYFQSWEDLENFEHILTRYCLDNTLLENVIQNWNTDYMFGYQFLNGCNPVMISKCVELPDNFPVTHEMVEGSLQRGLTLDEELKAGNIYIANYEILEGLHANKSSQNTPYYVTAPICLLYNNRLNQIVPIAIQLSQTGGDVSPIFLPNDDEYDWMLAKMWVKSADFNVHQLLTHLLKTHLLSEVFEVAMYRQLSAVHPVYKLLVPHVRFTIAINAEARKGLISEDGIFSKISSLSGDGIKELMKRGLETLTYKSLCFPEAIKARGMEKAPNYYYREDGMRIWETLNRFVSDVVEIYYDSDEAVRSDVEIQKFVKDISLHGLQDKTEKFPKGLYSRVELVEYLTAVIFTASAQHAAVNFGQFDWYGWIPNSPSTMRKPPPQDKGTVNLKIIMETLPDRDCSSLVLGTAWSLTRFQENERFLGFYPDMYFTEQPVKQAIKTFRKKLDDLTDQIKSRNKTLTMDYCYLSPDKIPNSVAV
ncbi:polyunsaturated fatty acid 5-lipoxygenase [Labeo rohita]|uniref:polyunsaturated fatty acid 5-lipoxygenase n=1 Tax=Labeo rohita TaxID=84645 RepID=UPI0021E2FD18|nr:polyunsaturated fatty acid 5-lipoxygenase [Labeo rohita]